MKEAVFCIDIGTSSLKAALISMHGEVFSFARVRFENKPMPFCWQSALQESLIILRSSTKENININSICISGNGPTVVSDKFFHLWNHPNGTQEDMKRYNLLSGKSLFLPRLLYCMEYYAKEWESSKLVFSGPEYLIYTLTGTAVTVLPEKRFEAAYWNDESLEKCKIPKEKIPPFVAPGFFAGNLLETEAKVLNLKCSTKVYCGLPDFIAALIGTSTLKSGRLCDRAGSSEGLNLCVEKIITNSNIRFLPSVVEGLWNASVLLPESGARFARFKKNSEYKELSSAETVKELLKNKNSDGYKLLCSISEEVKNGINLLEKTTGFSIETMRVTGGQAHNSQWNQFKANMLGIKIETTQILDAELMGNAITAFVGMNLFSSLTEGAEALVKTAQVFEPQLNSKSSNIIK
ncbi:MAG: hypothetical protein GX297_00775 [Treponema sp.]|nr:hypothetical protein [Treponema sp.]